VTGVGDLDDLPPAVCWLCGEPLLDILPAPDGVMERLRRSACYGGTPDDEPFSRMPSASQSDDGALELLRERDEATVATARLLRRSR
jgi:hypothetical protein